MKITYNFSNAVLTLLALANWSLCFQTTCHGAQQTPASLAERIRVLEAEDPRFLPSDRSDTFLRSIRSESERAGLTVMSYSSVISRTNTTFGQVAQNLSFEATEPQLLNFLRNLAASNSTLRVRSVAFRPAPDRSHLRGAITITGVYHSTATEQSQKPAAAQAEYQILNERRQLRRAALDCYELTKSTLPPGWTLDSFTFMDGRKLSLQGEAPATPASPLEDVQAKFEQAQAQDGKSLFVPSSCVAAMRIIELDRTKFSWSMSFDVRSLEPR